MEKGNDVCGIGVSYNSFITGYTVAILYDTTMHVTFVTTLFPGLRLISSLAGATDMDEAEALAWQNDAIDIYSNSWGPVDDGLEVSGPGDLLQMALETSTREVAKTRLALMLCEALTFPCAGTSGEG